MIVAIRRLHLDSVYADFATSSFAVPDSVILRAAMIGQFFLAIILSYLAASPVEDNNDNNE